MIKKICLFICLLLMINTTASITFADEVKPFRDYVFTSYDLMNSYEVNKVAKKIQENKYEKAEEELNYIPQMYRNTGEYYLCLGEVELHKNNLDLAGVYFTKALEIVSDRYYGFHNQPLVYNEIAKVHLAKGNYEKALDYSEKALNSRKLEKEFIVTRINILKQYNNKAPKALIKSDTFITDIPELKDYKDNVETWVSILETLSTIDLLEQNSEYSWGEIFSITKTQKEKRNKRDKLLKNLPLAYMVKTELTYSLGYKDEARNLVHELINVASTSGDNQLYAKAYWVQAMILCDGFDDYKNSIIALTNALQLDPTNPLYYLQRSWAYIKNKQNDFAIADVDKCIELRPNSSTAYEYKANYLEYMGKRQEALENYKKALEINPNSKNAKNNIDRIQGKIKADAKQKASGIDTYTSTRLSVSANLVDMMKGAGFLKRIQKGSNKTIIFFVDEKSWYNSSADGFANTITIVEEYAYLRGYEIIDFKSNSSGNLLYRHRIKFIEIP